VKQSLNFAFVVAGLLAVAPHLSAQAPAAPPAQNPAAAGQKPAAAPQYGGNPFPEDENSVPVMPSKDAPDLPFDAGMNDGRAAAPPVDRDPVRSPDDFANGSGSQTSGFSSSLSGLDNLPPPSDDAQPGKRGKKGAEDTVPEHQETAKEDLTVGKYYLDNKDWRAALSRYQSALVLAPDEPDVYWGLAESERHLGNFADARANYQKVIDYDPDSRHAKDAAKALKEPELANAKPQSDSINK